MFEHSRRSRKSQMSEINVVPYIDVMLVLLVIFMVTAPMLSQGVKVELPRAEAERMVQSARANDRFLMEAMWSWFMPAWVEMRRRIEAGEIGEIRLVDAKPGCSFPTNTTRCNCPGQEYKRGTQTAGISISSGTGTKSIFTGGEP